MSNADLSLPLVARPGSFALWQAHGSGQLAQQLGQLSPAMRTALEDTEGSLGRAYVSPQGYECRGFADARRPDLHAEPVLKGVQSTSFIHHAMIEPPFCAFDSLSRVLAEF